MPIILDQKDLSAHPRKSPHNLGKRVQFLLKKEMGAE